MQTLTYKQAYDKIIDAYFKNEIQPYDMQFCFCGTLAWSGRNSGVIGDWSNKDYSTQELRDMEHALLVTIQRKMKRFFPYMSLFAEDYSSHSNTVILRERLLAHEKFEDALFDGMCAA